MIVTCPICKKKTPWEDNPYRPFCSERCKLIDLGNWASGKYFIPGKEEPEKPKDGVADEKNEDSER